MSHLLRGAVIVSFRYKFVRNSAAVLKRRRAAALQGRFASADWLVCCSAVPAEFIRLAAKCSKALKMRQFFLLKS